MDNHERRPRQSNAPGFAGPAHAQHHQHPHHQHHTSVSGTADRFQPAGAGRPASNMPYPHGYTATQAAPAGYPDLPAVQSGASMPAGSLQYQAAGTDFAPNSAQRGAAGQSQQNTTPQSQQAGAAATQQAANQGTTPYHHGMYAFQQNPQQGTPPSPYDSVQPYATAPRQSTAAIDVLSNQFGVPQGYYVGGPGDAGGPTSTPNAAAAAAAAGMAGTQQAVAQGYNHPSLSYTTTQSPVGRDSSSMVSAYGTGLPAETAPASGAGAQAYGQPTAYTEQANTTDMDNAYNQYQTELRRTFEHVRDGHLSEAGTLLLRISDWLLGNADNLGLVRDDAGMHSERLKLWNEFNTCWLAVLQRQKELTIDVQTSGQRPPQTSLLEYDQMENMGKELVRLCDIMEKHGLVDYEMGVWEEEIMNLLTHCLDLLEEGSAPIAQQNATRRR